MKLTVFSAKGGAGKTPISVNIALDRGYAVGTNETYHVLDKLIPAEHLLAIAPDQAFPKLPAEIDVVFDLGGAIGGESAPSIRSAVEQSDLVLVPVYNEFKAINGAYHTILEIRELNPRIVVIGTKLEQRWNEKISDWTKSADYNDVANTLAGLLGEEFPVIPLKLSKGFDAIFTQEQSLRQMVEAGGLDSWRYRQPADQFDEIYKLIDGVGHGSKK